MIVKLGKIDLRKEPAIVQQAYLTAKGAAELGDEELIKELSDLLTKHSVKAMMKIQEFQKQIDEFVRGNK
jgi:hypothetical protein